LRSARYEMYVSPSLLPPLLSSLTLIPSFYLAFLLLTSTFIPYLIRLSFRLLLPRSLVPTPHRLTYSTCSTHPTEDEHVVLRALQSPEAIAGGWTLAPRSSVLPNWPRRGRLDEFTKAETKWGKGGGGKAVERRTEWSEGVVRCDAAEGDACNVSEGAESLSSRCGESDPVLRFPLIGFLIPPLLLSLPGLLRLLLRASSPISRRHLPRLRI
jgi:hypothetical protein